MGVVHRPNPDWASHIPVLIRALELTDGNVLELGMGIMSTPLLHILCEARGRYLDSFDNDKYYTELFSKFTTENHKIGLCGDDWSAWTMYRTTDYSVALIDHKPAAQRKEDIKRLINVDYIVIHDTQEPADEDYGYDEIYPLFKYRYDYKKFNTWTTVLSNKHDVEDLFHNT